MIALTRARKFRCRWRCLRRLYDCPDAGHGGGDLCHSGYDPAAALYQFFIAPVSRPDQVADLFIKACPLIMIASGLVFAYRANVWNIRAEGQMILGAMFAGHIALTYPGLSVWVMMPLMILAGMVGGLLWAMIPAVLKAVQRERDTLSLMLTYVAALLLDWTVRGPWLDPMSFGFPLTPM